MHPKLSNVIAEACERSEALEQEIAEYRGYPQPGDKFVFRNEADNVGLEWLFVRFLDGDRTTVLFVPVDTWDTLVGTPDVPLGRIEVARCGESEYLPVWMCLAGNFCGSVTPAGLLLVRRKLAALARGECQGTPVSRWVDFDPEYEEHMYDVRRARVALADVK